MCLALVYILSARRTMMALAEYQWFLPAVIVSFHSRPAKFFPGFAKLIATLGNQTGQSLYVLAFFFLRQLKFTVAADRYPYATTEDPLYSLFSLCYRWLVPLRKRLVRFV